MSTYTIGKLAEAAGVHVETIRYYERRGLIAPPPRSPSGYRQYGAEDLWRLQLIARGKDLGFTLAEIADVMGTGPGAGRSATDVRAAAQRKIAVLDERRRQLDHTCARLHQLVNLCDDGHDADCRALRLMP
jgi:DNA-binding transcriptional MerR regulator